MSPHTVLPLLQVDIGYLRSLTKRRNYSVLVVLAALGSLTVAFNTRKFAANNMSQAVYSRNQAAIGVEKIAYM
jgi:hypothetical protein